MWSKQCLVSTVWSTLICRHFGKWFSALMGSEVQCGCMWSSTTLLCNVEVQSRFHPGSWVQVSSWFLDPGFFLVLGSRLRPGSWVQVTSWFLSPGFALVLRSWFHPGFVDPGFILVLRSRVRPGSSVQVSSWFFGPGFILYFLFMS